MTTPARRAVAVGAELDRLTSMRRRRQRMLARPGLADQLGPVGLAVFLMDQARLDARRRQLAALMLDQMLAAEAAGWRPYHGAGQPPADEPPWPYEGRHAYP